MTTFTNFVPGNQVPFSFQPTLDGQVCTVTVTWNLFGVRYYLNLYAPDGHARGLDRDGRLARRRRDRGARVGERLRRSRSTPAPHGYKVGRTIVVLTVSGARPDAYNGTVEMPGDDGPTTLTFPLAADPGAATVFGFGGLRRQFDRWCGGHCRKLLHVDAGLQNGDRQMFEVNP